MRRQTRQSLREAAIAGRKPEIDRAGKVRISVSPALTIQIGAIARDCSCPPQTQACMWLSTSSRDDLNRRLQRACFKPPGSDLIEVGTALMTTGRGTTAAPSRPRQGRAMVTLRTFCNQPPQERPDA